MAEDAADAGGRGGSGGKKESASSKAAADGKLVKGTLGLAFRCPPALAGRGCGFLSRGGGGEGRTPAGGAVLAWAPGRRADARCRCVLAWLPALAEWWACVG